MTSLPPISAHCLEAQTALEQDPLALPAAVEAHVRTCMACSELRILWLAMEEAPEVAVAPGYFEDLGFRILRKLPSRSGGARRTAALWLAAAALVGAVGLGATGFYLGRAVRVPMVEAAQPRPAVEATETNETPFFETEDALSQLSNLSPEAADRALQRLEAAKPAASAP